MRATWGFLSDKLNIRQSALSRENIRGQLLAGGIPGNLIDRLNGLLDTCEMALFAPSVISGGMETVYQEALSLISDIDKQM